MTQKLLKRDIGVSETTLKRTKATRLDIAVLAEQLHDLKAETCRDVEASRASLRALDEKMTAFDATVDSIGGNIGQCQNVIVAVKETLDAQTGRFTMALRESEEHQQGRFAAADERMKAADERLTATDERMTAVDERLSAGDERMNEMTGSINDLAGRLNEMTGSINDLGGRSNEMSESIRSIEEKNLRQFETVQSRIRSIEEHLPKLETEMKALDGKADRIEQFQQKINARIVAVMRMSLAIVGVVVVTAIVFGFFLLKR